MAYLAFLGVQAWRGRYAGDAADSGYAGERRAAIHGWRQGFLSNITNPKVLVFYLAVLPQFLPADASIWQLLLLALTHALLGLAYLLLLVTGLHLARRLLTSRTVRRGLDAGTGAAQPAQPGQPIPGQHAMHGGGVQAEQEPDPGRPPPSQNPNLDDPPLGTSRSATRTAVRAAGTIGHPDRTQLPVPTGPPRRGSRRDLETFRGPPKRPSVLHDAPGQLQTTTRGKQRINVGHEDLRVEERFLDSSTPHSEVFPLSAQRAVTNVRGQYS